MRDIKCIVFGLAIWALFGLYVSTADAQTHRAEIAAVVNDDIITTSDVETRLLLNAGGRPIPPAERQMAVNAVLDELINESIQRQEADSLNISVEQSQINEAFASVAQKNGMAPAEFENVLKRSGIPRGAFDQKLRTDIAWGQVVRRKLRPQVSISENDIDAVFDTMDRSAGETQYRVAEIFLADDVMTDDAPVERRMDEIIAMLQKGARFSEVAQKFSEAPGASRGGDLGWLTLDQLDAELQPTVLNMQKGELARPFKTGDGYHLLYLIDKKAGASVPVSATPAQQAAPEAVGLQQIFIPVNADEPEALRNTKLARADALKNELKSCADMKAKLSDFTNPLTGDLGLVPVTELPDAVRAEINDLPIGTLSRPMMNNQGIFVLMVCERPVAAAPQQVFDATPRGDEAAREQVANNLGMQKLDVLQQRYLRDLRSAAFIDRRI